MDGWNVHGRTADLTLVGYGASDLDDYARDAAGEQGASSCTATPEPEKGFYYRSDHFNFAKEGVPALDPTKAVDFIGKPADYGQKVRDEWTEQRLPQAGRRREGRLGSERRAGGPEGVLRRRLPRRARRRRFPEWKPGNEFKAKRDAMLKLSKPIP